MNFVKKLALFILVFFLLGNIDVFASTKVNIRTESNYYLPSDVRVSESNKQSILSTPAVDASEKIYDFAELLTETEEKKLYKKIKYFVKETELDLVIVTIKENVKGNSGDSATTRMKAYSHDFYDYNDFKNNGLLLLIDMQAGGIYMVTEGKAVELFPNSRMNPILKNVYDKLSERKYFDACNGFITSVSDFVDIGVPGDEDLVIDDDGNVVKDKLSNILWIVLSSLVISGIIVGIMISSYKNVKLSNNSHDYLNRNSVNIITISEMYLGGKTNRALLNKNNKRK